jgi:hypothetical protein
MAFVFKQYTACLLLLSVLLQTFSTAVIYVDFYANQDYIARNLCENRDKPMLHCCGRCQLRKRLTRQDNQDKSNPEKKDNETRYPLFDKAGAILELPILAADPLHHIASPCDARIIRQTADIFHPPD